MTACQREKEEDVMCDGRPVTQKQTWNKHFFSSHYNQVTLYLFHTGKQVLVTCDVELPIQFFRIVDLIEIVITRQIATKIISIVLLYTAKLLFTWHTCISAMQEIHK